MYDNTKASCDLVKGRVYRTRRGRHLRLRAWLYEDGLWFRESESPSSHVWERDDGKNSGRFIRTSTFRGKVVERVE